MTILDRLPPRDIDGADVVSEGLLEASSGNLCRLWFAFTHVPEQNQTRIGLFYEWRCATTQGDLDEALAFANMAMKRQKPELVTTTVSADPCKDRANSEWLRTGKLPRFQ